MIPHVQRKKNSRRRHKRMLKERGEYDDNLTLYSAVKETVPRPERRLRRMDAIYGVGRGPAKLRKRLMDRLQRFWNNQTT